MTVGPYSVGNSESYDSQALRNYIRGVRSFGGSSALSDAGGPNNTARAFATRRGVSPTALQHRASQAGEHGIVEINPSAGGNMRRMNPLLQGLAGIGSPTGMRGASNLGDFDWGSLIDKGFDFAGKIIMTRPGTYVQSGSNIMYTQPVGSTQNLPFAAGTVNVSGGIGGDATAAAAGASAGTLLLIGGAVVLVMLMSRGGR